MAIRQLAKDRDYLLLTTPDDTEDSPWMVMGDPQWHAVDQFMSVLNLHVRRRRLPWYTASYMKITMRRPDGRPLDVAPDAFKVEADPHWRQSYDVDAEGKPPELVVEVVSPWSYERDLEDKPTIYDAMGVREFVIFFSRRRRRDPELTGYRRDRLGQFVPWQPDERGVLWCETLGGLGITVADGRWLRLVDADGQLLPTAEEEADALLVEQERLRAVMAEAERLREELRRLKEGDTR